MDSLGYKKASRDLGGGAEVKRKYADRLDWHRVLDRNFVCKYFHDNEFEGYATLITIHQVKEPLTTVINGEEVLIVDDGYYWMQHFPSQSHYCVTTMFNDKKEIIQWYFDISKQNGISDQGIPFWDDLYLDVMVLPNGKFQMKDEDELEDALNRNAIELDDYYLAKNTMKDLIKSIKSMSLPVMQSSEHYFNLLLKHVKY